MTNRKGPAYEIFVQPLAIRRVRKLRRLDRHIADNQLQWRLHGLFRVRGGRRSVGGSGDCSDPEK